MLKCRSVDISSNISASICCIRLKIPPFEPDRRDESNGGYFILIWPPDAKIFNEMSLFVDVSPFISAFNGHIRMKQPPFDSSQRAGSNGGIFNLSQPMDAEIFGEMSQFVDISPFISASSGCRKMWIPPFDSSRRAGSNGGIRKLLQPMDAEIYDEMLTDRHFNISTLRHFTFRWISRHPVVAER